MMAEYFMGPDNFKVGIQNFLKKYQFANAATADLWRELQVRIIFYFYFRHSVVENMSVLGCYARFGYS